jgi:hypothetical protein
MKRMLEGLTPEERDSLARLLGRLYEVLQEASPGMAATDEA